MSNDRQRVVDVHVHVQPWDQLRPEVLNTLVRRRSDRARVESYMSDPDTFVAYLDSEGDVVLHRNIKSTPEAFLKAIEPHRKGLVVAVECIFTWYWLADLCEREGIEFVLGHALYMKAIHGAKAKNDRLDAFNLASLLRPGPLTSAMTSQ